jgi:hypothetical protein
MKLKFEKTISELGIEDAKFSKGITNGIKEIRAQQSECEKLSNNLIGYHEDDRAELEEQLELEIQLLNLLDEKLSEKIVFWDSKKEIYAANAQKLSEYRAGKPVAEKSKGAISDARPPKAKGVQTQVSEEPIIEKENINTELPKYEEPKDEEKQKSNDWTWWLLGGIIGIATLGAVVLKRR